MSFLRFACFLTWCSVENWRVVQEMIILNNARTDISVDPILLASVYSVVLINTIHPDILT